MEPESRYAAIGAAVLLMIAEAPEARGLRFEPRVRVATGGSPPSPTILARMDALGVDVTHLYVNAGIWDADGSQKIVAEFDCFGGCIERAQHARSGHQLSRSSSDG